MRVLDETWGIVLLAVIRYVERNPLRAGFVNRADDWKWGSASLRRARPAERRWLAIPEIHLCRATGVAS